MNVDTEFHLGSQYAAHLKSIKKTLWFYKTVLRDDQKVKLIQIRNKLRELVDEQIKVLQDSNYFDDKQLEVYIAYVKEQANDGEG